jgi:outer membrane protein assembly factor BamD
MSLSLPYAGALSRAAAAALVALTVGCAGTSPAPKTPDAELAELYAEAREQVSSGNYEAAIKALERLEARATGTLLGQQALLDLAHAQWKYNERASALATVDRFMRLHPSSPAMDYALYLRGLINFNDSVGAVGVLAGQRVSERDQQASREAYQAFRQLIQQFPDSRYAPDALQRMDFILNALAEAEVAVARYYLGRGAYVAAANRAKQAVVEYEKSPAVEEALAIMAESYDRLGLTGLRDDARRVLRSSFPQSRFLGGATGERGATTRPWWRPW